MKVLLPWIGVVGLAVGLGLVYSASLKKDAELAALRDESQQLQKLRADLEETNKSNTQVQSDELTRLRKDNEDLLRLRNEVSQLRKEKQQLATQVQTAQAQAQGAQSQMQALRVNPVQPPIAGQLNPAVAGVVPGRPATPAQATEQIQTAICINNLRMIEGAKQQWALEKQKPQGALLIAADLAPYLKTNVLPTCPAGGVYTINPVGYAPLCSIPGHTLGK
jgi:TolA-binding protein